MITPRTCWLVGQGALLVECGERLLSRGHRLTGLASAPGLARDWGRRLGVPDADRVRELPGRKPDWLFSVVNPDVLTADEIAAATELAANFHSSPLPRYAGVHQTSWAITNGEREYGVTWHVLRERLDSGEILVQRLFPLAEDETALTLNVKCYDHGLATFEELLNQAERGALNPVPQDLSRRGYHSRRQRLPCAGLVSDVVPGEEAQRWKRAATVGRLDNEFGLPKLLVRDSLVVLDKVALGSGGELPPDAVPVTTEGRRWGVERVRTLSGAELSGRDWAEAIGVDPAADLLLPPEQLCRRAGARDAELCLFEDHWVSALAAVRPSPVLARVRATGAHWSAVRLPRPGGAVANPSDRRAMLAALARAWVTYSAGFGEPTQTFWWSETEIRGAPGGLDAVFATAVPVTVDTRAPDRAAVDVAVAHGTYARDVAVRRHGARELVPEIAFVLDAGPVRLRPLPTVTVCLEESAERLHILAPDAETGFAVASVLAGALVG
ncbi:formyltransferase family protein [Amycolatopsis sp. NPDC005003]